MRLGLGLGLSAYAVGSGGGITTLSMTGLTGGEARPGSHASISVGFPSGVTAWTSQTWGTSYGASTYGTGSSPTDYTAGDLTTLYWEGVGDDGNTYRASALISRGAPSFPVQPSANASLVEPGQTITITQGTVSHGTRSVEFSLFNDSSVTMSGNDYTSGVEGIFLFQNRVEYGGYVVYSDVVTVEVNIPGEIDSLAYDDVSEEADVTTTETGTVYIGFWSASQSVVSTVIAGTGAAYHTSYEFLGTSDSIALDISGMTNGDYYLCSAMVDESGAPSTAVVVDGPITITGGASGFTPPVFEAAGTHTASTGAINVAWPTHATGDQGVAFLTVRADQSAPTDTTGWTSVGAVTSSSSTTEEDLHVFSRVAASGSESAIAIADGGNYQAGLILTWQGVASISVLSSGMLTAGTSFTIPGGTSTQDNSLIVIVAIPNEDTFDTSQLATGPVNANLSALTTRYASHYSAGAGGGFYVFEGLKATAGAIGDTTGSWNQSNSVTYMVLELKGEAA